MNEPITTFERARRFVAKMPGAVSGQDGHGRTFAVACVAAVGFGLSETEVRSILEEYNLQCAPGWSARELDHKCRQAMKSAEREPEKVGYLRDAPAPNANSGRVSSEFRGVSGGFRGVSGGKKLVREDKTRVSEGKTISPMSKKLVSEDQKQAREAVTGQTNGLPKHAGEGKTDKKKNFPPILPRKGRFSGQNEVTDQTSFFHSSPYMRTPAPVCVRDRKEVSEVYLASPPKIETPPEPENEGDAIRVAAGEKFAPVPVGVEACPWSPPPYYRRAVNLEWFEGKKRERISWEEDPAGEYVLIGGKHYLSWQFIEKRRAAHARKIEERGHHAK
jgi:hypothetical protein